MSSVAPRTDLPAAPLDGQARLVLVAWLSGWFALVAALLALAAAGGGAVASGAGMAAGAVVPALVLARVAGLPAAYEVAGGELVVRRWLLGDRSYRLRGPAAPEDGVAWLRRRRVLTGGGYGCRTVVRPADGRVVQLATTSLREVVRCDTPAGPLLVSPAEPEAFTRAVERVHQ